MTLDSNDAPERTLSRLVVEATQDIRTILRKEIQLAKTEVTGSLRLAGKAVPLLVVAGVLSLYGLGLLFTAIAWGLRALGLADWLAFLIVAVVVFVVAGVLALVGKRSLDKMNPRPQRTIASVGETVAQLKAIRQPGGAAAADGGRAGLAGAAGSDRTMTGATAALTTDGHHER